MQVNGIARNASLHMILDGRWKNQRPALEFAGMSLTYAELRRWVNDLASEWHTRGVRKGDRVALLMKNNLEWLPAYFSIARLGAICVPLNILLTTHEQMEIVKRCQPEFIIVDTHDDMLTQQALDVAPAVRPGPAVLSVSMRSSEICEHTGSGWRAQTFAPSEPIEESLAAEIDIGDILQIQFTSGTTGLPKGVLHSHESALWNAAIQSIDFGIRPDDVYMIAPSLCWAGGLHDFVFPTLARGGKVIVMPSGAKSHEYASMIESSGVTIALLVPTVLSRMLAEVEVERLAGTALRFVLAGGEALSPEVGAEFDKRAGVPLCQGYGQSEGPTIAVTQQPLMELTPGSVGHPASFTRVSVRDAANRPVAAGEQGLVVFQSPAASPGYWDDEAATMAIRTEDGWMKTGDLGLLDISGELFLLGRAKDMYVSGGLNVYPAEIEVALAAHEDVREVAVVGVADRAWGAVGHAHVVLNQGRTADERAIRDWLSDRIARYKVPKAWTITTEPLPRNASGKIVKARLLEE